jgi:hypothetical protein
LSTFGLAGDRGTEAGEIVETVTCVARAGDSALTATRSWVATASASRTAAAAVGPLARMSRIVVLGRCSALTRCANCCGEVASPSRLITGASTRLDDVTDAYDSVRPSR